VQVNGRELSANDVVVATGTEPGVPPIPGLSEARPQTNRTVFTLASRPARLAVIGGGPIGLELGQAFHRLGTEVTIFEASDRIAATEDAEVSLELTSVFEASGIRVVTGAAIASGERQGEEVRLTTGDGTFAFDDVLVAAGRKPQVPDGLKGVGLELDRRGFIAIDECGNTNLPGLWAAGDITGKFAFTHFAGYQAHHIAKHLEEGICERIPETLVPWAIFTEPEIGHAGMTEEQARALHSEVKVTILRASELDWFRTTRQTEGFAKIIAEAGTGRLLGAHFICARGSTLVGEACLAIQNGLTARQVASTIHPYPTASELFRWACAQLV
jgi:pyruvate/2-oxoglutarate dehydrogenase complex dihydrolipoamide dehydrogenase (E3) component